jgi:hypothetical protein
MVVVQDQSEKKNWGSKLVLLYLWEFQIYHVSHSVHHTTFYSDSSFSHPMSMTHYDSLITAPYRALLPTKMQPQKQMQQPNESIYPNMRVNANNCISSDMFDQSMSGYHDASSRHTLSTSPFFASARRPVHSSSPTRSAHSPSSSQLCQSSFG